MFVYYFRSMGWFRTQYTRVLDINHTDYPNECRWMVPGTFDCDGNSTL